MRLRAGPLSAVRGPRSVGRPPSGVRGPRSDRCRDWAGLAVTTAVALLIAGSSSVLACPMCFGAEETSMIDATKLGIVVMLAVTLAVQGGFVAFFLHLRKRAKQNAELELETEWSELQRPRT